MIAPKLQQLIGESLKAGNFLRTETLRMLSSSFNYERIALQHELSEEEEMAVIRKQAKQRRDSIEAYRKAGAEDHAKKEEEELKILQEFLPPEMDIKALTKLVTDAMAQVGAKNPSDLGRVIGLVRSKAPGVDGGRIAQIVNSKLNG